MVMVWHKNENPWNSNWYFHQRVSSQRNIPLRKKKGMERSLKSCVERKKMRGNLNSRKKYVNCQAWNVWTLEFWVSTQQVEAINRHHQRMKTEWRAHHGNRVLAHFNGWKWWEKEIRVDVEAVEEVVVKVGGKRADGIMKRRKLEKGEGKWTG